MLKYSKPIIENSKLTIPFSPPHIDQKIVDEVAGAKGTSGSDGSIGATGSTGAKGTTGTTGIKGPIGSKL